VFDSPTRGSTVSPPNLARFGFLDPAARDYFPDYDKSCHTSVAILRTEAGRDPHDRGLTDLVGELCTRSADFRTRWAAHDVRLHRASVKCFRPPRRRRTHPQLRGHGTERRHRTHPHCLHSRLRHALSRTAPTAGELGGNRGQHRRTRGPLRTTRMVSC
jgi:hypothetical protein